MESKPIEGKMGEKQAIAHFYIWAHLLQRSWPYVSVIDGQFLVYNGWIHLYLNICHPNILLIDLRASVLIAPVSLCWYWQLKQQDETNLPISQVCRAIEWSIEYRWLHGDLSTGSQVHTLLPHAHLYWVWVAKAMPPHEAMTVSWHLECSTIMIETRCQISWFLLSSLSTGFTQNLVTRFLSGVSSSQDD